MLKGIISISGHSELYKVISQGQRTMVVESLKDKKRQSVQPTQRLSALQDISMYTEDGDVKLATVLANVCKEAKGQPVLDAKKASADELKALMNKVLPNWDKDRIYTSDLKKLFSWYNQLQACGLVAEDMDKEEESAKAE